MQAWISQIEALEGQLFLAMPMPATSNQSTETPISSLDASNRTEEEEPVCEVTRSSVYDMLYIYGLLWYSTYYIRVPYFRKFPCSI